MNTTIAYLTPLYVDKHSARGVQVEPLLELARRVVEGSGRTCTIEVIAFGPTGREEDLTPGVRLRVLPIAYRDGHPLDVLSWDLPLVLAQADVVHIHHAHTRTGEMGLLLAKLQRKPVCVSTHGGASSSLGESINFLALADCLVALGDPIEDGPRLARIYQGLVGGVQEAA
ncbi:MAG TPA: glycosyltransferase [Gemmataceae bacterium]|nr:glycosyltransferase [Gemmataceae bacterium]